MKWMYLVVLAGGVLVFMLFASGCDSGSSGLGPNDGDTADGDACLCEVGCDAEGNCLAECAFDYDCPAGQVCSDGQCRNPGDVVPDGDNGTDDKPDGDTIIDPDGDSIAEDGDEDAEYDVDFETDIPHDPSNPWIQVDPLSVDFGAVPLGSAKRWLWIPSICMMSSTRLCLN
jgi:hypothetical protein